MLPRSGAAFAALAALVPSGCLFLENPAFEDEPFAYAVLGNSPATQSAALDRVLDEIAARPDVAFVLGAGNLAPSQRLHDGVARFDGQRDAPLVFFPAVGSDEIAAPTDLEAWAEQWARPWSSAPDDGRLARQLPGVTAFHPGPPDAEGRSGTSYGFEYRGALFVVLDMFERGAVASGDAGLWPGSPQLAWLDELLARSDADLRFAVGHVPLEAPCYGPEPLCHWWMQCDPGRELPWVPHPGALMTQELQGLLARYDVAAYFHAQDNLQGRILLDAAGARLFERLLFDVFDECTGQHDSFGTPAQWEEQQQPPGRMWQVDTGGISNEYGSYAIVTVDPDAITFELFLYLTADPSLTTTRLWDTWTVPR